VLRSCWCSVRYEHGRQHRIQKRPSSSCTSHLRVVQEGYGGRGRGSERSGGREDQSQHLSRVPGPNVNRDRNHKLKSTSTMSIKSESESEMQRLMSERLVREEFGTEFLKLFNTHCVDFVKRLPDGTYVPVEWPRQATHKLVATRWNNPEDFPVNAHGKRVVPDYLALSVCAVPLHRKRVLRGPAIKIRAPLPRIHPEYYGHGGVNGKRKVVFWMVKAMHARVKKTFVKRATEAQLDLLYRNLREADFWYE